MVRELTGEPCSNCGHPVWIRIFWLKTWTHRWFYGRCVYDDCCNCRKHLRMLFEGIP